MKERIFNYWFHLMILSVCFLLSCQKDNYPVPNSKLQGAILYKGDTIHVAANQVNFQLWQSGYGKLTPITVNVNQDGIFSALLFNGDYLLNFPKGRGPFISDKIDTGNNKDTIRLSVRGNTQQNIEVLPYYMVRNVNFNLDAGKIHGNFKLEKIITDLNSKKVEWVRLYVNKTIFVDNNNNIAFQTIDGSDIVNFENISLGLDTPQIVPSQDYFFVRIGIKIENVEDMLFSKAQKVELK